jgi:Flp pilus assembly protein TadG
MGARLRLRSTRQSQGGQGLVEFALVLPVFLLAVVGVLDVGRLVYVNSALSQAAREGARLGAAEASWIGITASGCVTDPGAIGATNPGAHVCPTNVAAFKSHVAGAVNRMAVSLGPITAVHLSCNVGTDDDRTPSGEWTEGGAGNGCHDGSSNPVSVSGDTVSVRIEYTYQPLTPIFSSLIGRVPLSASASMVIN